MGSQLVFGPERHKAFRLTDLIRTDEMRLREVILQTGVILVVDVLVVVGAQVASKMLPVQVIIECQVVEEELLAKVAVGVRQDLSMAFVTQITLLDMGPQGVHMVQTLLADEDCSAFEANFAERLLVPGLHVALERGPIRKLLLCTRTVWDWAVQCSQQETCLLGSIVVIVDRVVFGILLTLLFELILVD